MSTISSVGSAATQPPIKKRKVLDTNQIPALTSTYITWKDHTTKQNQLSDGNHQVQQIPQSPSIPMTLNELPDDCNMSAISSGGSGSRTAKSFEEMKRIKRQKTNLVGNHQVQQIPQSPRNRPIKKTVTKKSFAGVSVNQRDKNGHSKGDLSKLPNDVFTNISGNYLSRKEMAHFSCLSKEIESDLKQFAKRANTRLRKKLEQKISQTEIVGIQISPGPFRNDIHEMRVLEMQNNNLGTAIKVLEAKYIKNINEMKWTTIPLRIAAGMGDAELVDALIVAGADVNKADVDECTPLYEAASEGHKKVVDVLIAGGADVNKACSSGWTPLAWAVTDGYETVVKALVIAGADITLHVLSRLLGTTADSQVRVKKAIEEGKQKLISLYLSHVEKAAISPIHECESLTKTQKKQAKKYIEEREAAVAATTLQAMARGIKVENK